VKSSASSRSLLVLSTWFFILGPSLGLSPSFVPGRGSVASGQGTKDQERTKDQAPSTKDQPWLGTWQQVPPAKKWFDPWPYQKVTLRIEPAGDDLRVVYDMVRRRGGIQHMEWSGGFDGKDYPVQGVDYVLTNAYRRLSDRSYEIVVKVDGQTAAVATATVSADGRTLNVETKERNAKGQTATTTARYQRP
jgi:hypothetical protein